MAARYTEAWLARTLAGHAAVAAVNDAELAMLTEADALARADALLELGARVPRDPERECSSGFVVQQRLFGRARR
jgi:hypothetical protein